MRFSRSAGEMRAVRQIYCATITCLAGALQSGSRVGRPLVCLGGEFLAPWGAYMGDGSLAVGADLLEVEAGLGEAQSIVGAAAPISSASRTSCPSSSQKHTGQIWYSTTRVEGQISAAGAGVRTASIRACTERLAATST